jgi:S-adenosylmethionine decarboxylase
MKDNNYTDLAPNIVRQRMVLEGTLHNQFEPEDITRFAKEITALLNMELITSPILNHEPKYGWCGFVHWKESGMHIYTWDNVKPYFFSVDIYTCKAFNPKHVVNYANYFFNDNLIKITWKD